VIDAIIFGFPYITKEHWSGLVAPDGLEVRPGNIEMPKPKTVLLWGQNDLLTKAMEMFLTENESEQWNIIKLPANQCITALVEQVQKIKPDLVILYQAKPFDDSDELGKLIQQQPDLRMIIVSLENNVMQVYSKHSITVRHVSDLLSVIENRYFLDQPVEKEVSIEKGQ
jgi:hypothetical protein